MIDLSESHNTCDKVRDRAARDTTHSLVRAYWALSQWVALATQSRYQSSTVVLVADMTI